MLRTIALLAALAPAAHAQDAPSLSVELNALDDVEEACRMVFVAENGMAIDVTALVLEAVAFDASGGVAQISLFDFGELPAGLPRVRQFDLAGRACDDVGSILINGVQTCELGSTEAAECPLSVSSRTDVEVLG